MLMKVDMKVDVDESGGYEDYWIWRTKDAKGLRRVFKGTIGLWKRFE